MSTTLPPADPAATLHSLPTDRDRRVLWRFENRPELHALVESTRGVARGLVARLVATGARHDTKWTAEKLSVLEALDDAGVTSVALGPEHGGTVEGPKNLAFALAGFELAWVDGGAATSAMATNLALAPIQERGTAEQSATYRARCAPPKKGEDREIWRGAFALTEPLPNVGVNTGVLGGRVSIARWDEGEEPILRVQKKGRFITNMATAKFVTAAVESGDERIKGSCLVILEDGDPGTFDRGEPTRKLVHQLSSTRDPIFDLEVPASRIVGGYEVRDGVIVPHFDHRAIIAAVFRRTRVTVGLFTAAKVLSAIEPIVRYQRGRFRGGETAEPGTPFHDLGLQQKEDALQRLVEVWATGEASASLGFAAARLFDELDPLEREREAILAERGVSGMRALLAAHRGAERDAAELLELESRLQPDQAARTRIEELRADPLVRFALLDAEANVLCPATKLWNTGHGVNVMREAVSLVGGSGITEDCPGFLGQKWMDAQLEATYEGPEAVQRLQLGQCMTSPVFLGLMKRWVKELRQVASQRPGTGACTLATTGELWLWSLQHLLHSEDEGGKALFQKQRQGVTFAMADALAWWLAARQQVLDATRYAAEAGDDGAALAATLTDLCHVQAARTAGEVSRTCAELIFGYARHPTWEEDGGSCFRADQLVALEGLMPGLDAGTTDAIEADGSHPAKAGPCVKLDGLEPFLRLRRKLDGCLAGARIAKERAAQALTQVEIPETLDYPH